MKLQTLPVRYLALILAVSAAACQAQSQRAGALLYEPSAQYPFGRPNPAAPQELQQFAFMIGRNDCEEDKLNNATGEWESSRRSWDAYYYMNGFAIRDSARSGANHNGNIRIYDPAAQLWRVTFFSTPGFSSGVWSGGMEGDRLLLSVPQKAPGTDIDGISRLTFSNISPRGFVWTGEWVSADGEVVFPFWRISCVKVGPVD